MADNPKPCRWNVQAMLTPGVRLCEHPLVLHFNGRPRGIKCQGCPCHEPQPDPTPTGGKTGHDKP